MASGPPNSSEGGRLPLPDNSNSASSAASSHEDREVKYQTGLIPNEFAGLEVASPGMNYQDAAARGQYQAAPSVAAGGYVPYHDHQPGKVYDNQPYPHSAVATTYGGSQAGVPRGEKRIWGVRAATFWVALLALVFFLGTIGASAAAGSIAQAHASYVQTCQAKLDSSSSSSPAASASASGASSAASAASAAAASASGTSAASSAAAATATSKTAAAASSTSTSLTSIPLPVQASSVLGVANTNCPNLASENKTYTVPNSDLRFVRECGNNYPMNDLGKIPLTRMEDCMNLCAALSVTTQSTDGPCIGVAWVTAGKQGTDENYCWLKGAKGSPDPKANVEAAWILNA